jgi:hypothetical protein
MSDQESNPKSRREVWLSVALAVARDGMPEPQNLTFYDGNNRIVCIALHTHEAVRDWCAALNFDDPSKFSLNGSLWGFGDRDGWAWQIKCHRPEPPVAESSALAKQVAAAILLPDAEVSA